MNGLLLLVPFLLVRFGLLSAWDRGAVRRAAHFPPMAGKGRAVYWIYQAANAAIVLVLGFLTVEPGGSRLFWAGAALYAAGLILCGLSAAAFSAPSADGLCRSGLYRFSRNPMYVSYFLFSRGVRCWPGLMCWEGSSLFSYFPAMPSFWRRSAGVQRALGRPTSSTAGL